MSNKDNNSANVFTLEESFIDIKTIFDIDRPPIQSIIHEANIVLDTNILLLPYKTGSESLKDIEKTYTEIAKNQRLFIPERVAREFARNFPSKIGELINEINDHKSKCSIPKKLKLSILNETEHVQNLEDSYNQLQTALRNYQNSISRISDDILQWDHTDPVRSIYTKIFNSDSNIIKLNQENEEIQKTLKHRYDRKIPPGYKDQGKDDMGVGDLVIWLTILQLANTQEKHVIFVSSDEKADWKHSASNVSFMPRTELLCEFSSKSNGKSFYITNLSTLLKLFGNTNEDTLQKIETEEDKLKVINKDNISTDTQNNTEETQIKTLRISERKTSYYRYEMAIKTIVNHAFSIVRHGLNGTHLDDLEVALFIASHVQSQFRPISKFDKNIPVFTREHVINNIIQELEALNFDEILNLHELRNVLNGIIHEKILSFND